MRLDHVILATDDLDRTCRRLGELGLGWVPGGRHDDIGTLNRIVPLGTGYLELLTVVDQAEARTSAFGSWALDTTLAAGEALMGWAIAVDDIDAISDRLGTPVEPISRDGLKAHTAGLSHAARHPELPFFIARSVSSPDPGRTDAAHELVVDGFDHLELGGNEASLRTWLGSPCELEQIQLAFTPEASGVLAVGIRTAGGVLRV